MRLGTCVMLFLALTGSIACGSGAPDTEHWSHSARLGDTTLHVATTVVTLSTSPPERFRVSGTLRITATGMRDYIADPWHVVGAGEDDSGIVSDVMAVAITAAALARLSGGPHADAILELMGCGANCSGASTILTYDAARRTYVVAHWVREPDWDTLSAGSIVHIDAHHDAIATHAVGPFDDCHACLPGVVPVWYAVADARIVDISRRFSAALRADAAAAQRGLQHANMEIALFRYLADECRLGSCATAWHLVERELRLNGMSNALSQMRDGINRGGYGRL